MATTVSRLEVQVGADVSQAVGGLAAVSTGMETMGRQSLVQAAHFSRLGFLLGGVGAALAGAGKAGLGFFKESIDASVEYNRTAALTSTQVDKQLASFTQISRIGKDVARAIPAPFEQMQKSLFDIFSSMNVGAAGAERLLRAFAKGAVAGQTDVQTAGRATIAIMNAFHKPVSEVNNVMDVQFKVVQRGVITYEEFARTIGRSIPSAVKAGQTIEDLGGIIAFLTRNGLSAAQATVSAARGLDLLSNPKFGAAMKGIGIAVSDNNNALRPMAAILEDVKKKLGDLPLAEKEKALKAFGIAAGDGTGKSRTMKEILFDLGNVLKTMPVEKQAAAFKTLGVDVKGAGGNLRPMVDVMADLREKLKGVSEVERAGILKELTKSAGGTIQAMRFLNLAVDDSEGLLQKLTKEIKNSGGAAEDAYKIMKDTPAAQIQLLKNNWQILRVEIGDQLRPHLIKLVGIGLKLVNWFEDLNPRIREVIVGVAFFGSVALVLIGTLGIAVGSLLALAAAFSLMGVASGAASLALSVGFMGALLAIPLAIGVLALNWDNLMKKWRTDGTFIHELGDIFEETFHRMAGVWAELVNTFEEKGFSGALKTIPKFIRDIGEAFGDGISDLAGEIGKWFSKAIHKVDWANVGTEIGKQVGAIIGGIANFAVDIASALLRLMGEIDWFAFGVGAAVFVAQFIIGAISGIWNSGLLGNLGSMITENLKPIAIAALVMGLAPAGLQNFIVAALGRLPLVGAIAGKIANVFSLASTLALGPIGRTTHILGTKFMAMLATSMGTSIGLIGAIGARIGMAFQAAGSAAVTFMSGPWGWVVAAIVLAAGLIIANWDKIGPFFSEMWAKAQEAFQSFWDWVTGFFASFSEWRLSVGASISGIVDTVVEWFSQLPSRMGEWTSRAIETVVKFFSELPGKVATWLGNTLTAMLSWVAFAMGWALGFGIRVGLIIAQFFIELPGKVQSWLMNLIQTAWNWLTGTAIPWAIETGRRIVTTIVEWVQQLPGRVADWFRRTSDSIQNAVGNFINAAQRIGREVVNNVVNFIQGLPERVSNFVSNAVNSVQNAVGRAASAARDFGRNILDSVVDFVRSVPSRVSDFFSDIPGFIRRAVGNLADIGRRLAGDFVRGFKAGIFGSPRTIMEYTLLDAFGRMQKDVDHFVANFKAMEPIEFTVKKTGIIEGLVGAGGMGAAGVATTDPNAPAAFEDAPPPQQQTMLNIENLNITSVRPEDVAPDLMEQAGWMLAGVARGRL